MEYIAGHPIYYHWWPLFTVLLGNGCRIGESLGLRWEDLDFENKVIQSVMGHRNIETTMDIYAEATEEKKQETVEGLADKLDNLF